MAVHDEKACLCRGFPTVDYFERRDLEHIKRTWSTSEGSPRGIRRQAQTVYRAQFLGVLDISTKTWRHLSETRDNLLSQPQYEEPGVRKNLTNWVDETAQKIYIMCGMADRKAAQMFNEDFASSRGYVYDNCWFWDIKQGRWQLSTSACQGTTRAPVRSCLPATFVLVISNLVTEQTVMYGGYNPALTVYVEASEVCFGFNYFSDGSSQTLPWGPIYRDIQSLRVDPPGGLFGEVDWEDGRWQPCYSCDSEHATDECLPAHLNV
ncbi:hypothetical protein BD414DRAFT_539561 [Trametes punicea]|nr:hypothetical protein BD414DRAFT_539561 [Trametes punicea]